MCPFGKFSWRTTPGFSPFNPVPETLHSKLGELYQDSLDVCGLIWALPFPLLTTPSLGVGRLLELPSLATFSKVANVLRTSLPGVRTFIISFSTSLYLPVCLRSRLERVLKTTVFKKPHQTKKHLMYLELWKCQIYKLDGQYMWNTCLYLCIRVALQSVFLQKWRKR